MLINQYTMLKGVSLESYCFSYWCLPVESSYCRRVVKEEERKSDLIVRDWVFYASRNALGNLRAWYIRLQLPVLETWLVLLELDGCSPQETISSARDY